MKNRDKSKEVWEQGLFKLYDFVKNTKLSKVSERLHIEGWHPVSQLFFYFSLIGSGLITLTILNILPWVVMWVYVIAWIILLGFIFAKPGQKYRITYVLGAFIILFFIVSSIVPNTLKMMSTDIPEKPGMYWNNTRGVWEFVDLDGNVFYYDSEKWEWVQYDDDEMEQRIAERAGQTTEYEFRHIWDDMQKLNENPFGDIDAFLLNVFDIINWIVFMFMVVTAGATVGYVWTLQFSKAAKGAASVALSIVFYVAILGIIQMSGFELHTIWDTIGKAWFDFLSKIGLASLDQAGNGELTGQTLYTGLIGLIPVAITCISLGLAIVLRHTAFNSILYIKSMRDDGMIEINRNWKIKPSALALLLIVVVGMSGYILTTASPLGSEPIIPLMFFMGSIVIILLIGTGDLILNEKANVLKRTFIWTIYGIMLLYLWFLVFQPTMYEMGLIGDESGMLSLSQEQQLFESSYFEQLFTVAMPETLIFQIAFIGISRRTFFQIGKGRELDLEEERLKQKKRGLMQERRKIRKIIIGSNSRENMIKLTKYIHISQQINRIQLDLKEKTKIPFRKVLFSGLFGAIVGSFFFSYYHSFRRGYVGWQGLLDWWQNPALGITYFGAGMILSLVAMFSWPAAILVHYLNNIMSMWLGGTL